MVGVLSATRVNLGDGAGAFSGNCGTSEVDQQSTAEPLIFNNSELGHLMV